MGIDFPAEPLAGDTYTENGIEFLFTGTKWKLSSKQYFYKGTALVNTNNQTEIDLITGNFFDLSLDEQTEIVFVNPPDVGTAQKFYLRLGIGGDYLDTNIEGYDLSTASYDNVSFDVSAQDTNPSGIHFKPDGTRMYMVGYASDSVHSYTLSTAWDISTASYDNVSFSVASQETIPLGIHFKPDGTKMYMVGVIGDSVYSYTLSTAWDLSTASYDNVSFDVSSQDSLPSSINFKPDGTQMYMVGYGSDSVHSYTLSTAWDISTASYDNVSFSVAAQDTSPRGMHFKPDGTRMYMVGSSSESVYSYTLSTAWDISTASYDNVSFSVASQETIPSSIHFKPDGTQMCMVGYNNDSVHQYTTGSTTTDTVPNITWPTSITWESGNAPTLPDLGETDLLEFYTSDGGTTYYAKLIEDNIS